MAATPGRKRATAEQWGQVVGVAWFLGGFVVLFVCAIAQVGPSAWVASWQMRHWGYDNVLLSFLPGFLALLAPFVVLACLPRRPGFWSGARVLWQAERPPTRVPPPALLAHRLAVMGRVCAGLALLAIVAGAAAAYWLTRPGDVAPGSPLPEIGLTESAGAGALPSFARLRGAVPHAELAWAHDEVLRRTTVHDVYVPLTGPAWRMGDPVAALELVRGGDRPLRPLEGKLSRGVPAWLAAAMREHQIALVAAPLVLTRQVLDGVVPQPDWTDAIAPGILGGAFALVFAAMAFSCWRARRRLVG